MVFLMQLVYLAVLFLRTALKIPKLFGQFKCSAFGWCGGG
jgi:hypothetical protein